ncbi:MAG: PAS domain S-box protein [bacterium]
MPASTTPGPPEVPDPPGQQRARRAEGPLPGFLETANASSDCIFWVKDTQKGEARFQFVNRAFEEATGRTSSELCSLSLRDLLTPEQYDILRERHLRQWARPHSFSHPGIVGLKGRGGNRIEVELHACLVRSLQPFSAVYFCRELDRPPDPASRYYELCDNAASCTRGACQADRIAARYYELYDNAMDCTFTLNQDGRIQNGNKKFEELTGCRTGMLEEGLFEIMPPENARRLIRFLRLQSEESPCCQIRFTDAGGEQKCLDVTTIRNPASDQEIIVNIRDVTHLKRLEDEIRESEEKYRSLVEQSRDLIFVLVGEEIVFANSMLYAIAGERRHNENMIWKEYIRRFALREDRSQVIAFFNKAAHQALDRNTSIEFKVKDKGGTIRDILLTMDTINYQGQKAQIGVARDITERKKLEQKTRETEKLGALAQFTASVAHEIRNPLEGLTSAVLLLMRSLDVQGENRELLDVIGNTANEISSTINQVVSMIHEPKYNFSEIDVRSLVAGAIRSATRCRDYDPRVRITTSFQRGVGAVQGDETLLRKAFGNILCNSFQAVNGAGRVRVHVAHVQQGSQRALAFIVGDTGTGIPAHVLPQLWEPFVTSKKRGMGLGLFITKRIIEDHGGSISVVRTGKRGTTFRFTVPVEPITE